MRFILTVFVVLAGVIAYAEKQPYERYQSIVERQMFGPLPPNFDPTKMPSEVSKSSSASEKELTQEQEKLQSSIHFSMINVTPDGATAVGFTDNSDPKAPVAYYLKVGERRNGWEVKEADPVKATMTIAKGEIEVSLSLGGNSAKDGGTSKAGSALASAANSGMRRPNFLGGRPLGDGPLRAKRLLRRQEKEAAAERQREEQEAKAAQAEADRVQREAEAEAQRQELKAAIDDAKAIAERISAGRKFEAEPGADSNEDD